MNNTNEPIYFLSDIDGVVVDWLDGFIKYCESIGHKALHSNPIEFSMTDIFPTLERPWEHIMDYQHTKFYQELKAYPDAVAVYNKLYDMGVKIVFVTSCGTTPEIIDARTNMMNSTFNGKFETIEFLELGASKVDILKKYPTATFIDDQMKVALEGVESGHHSFVKNMSYNTNDHNENVERLMSFTPLISYFSKKMNPDFNKKTQEDMVYA